MCNTAVRIMGTEISKQILYIEQKLVKFPAGGRLTSWLFAKRGGVESGITKHNPSSAREEDLNSGPPDYKSSTLTTATPHSPDEHQ